MTTHETVIDELPARRTRVRSMVREKELQGLVLYSDAGHPGNVRYLTNFTPFFGPAVLLVREDGETILLISFVWEIPRGRMASGLDRIESGFDTPGMLRSAMADLGLGPDARVGLVGADTIPHALYVVLTEGGRSEPVNIGPDFEGLRLIKSPVEQDMLRRAAAITDAAFDVVRSEVRAGMTEIAVAALAEYTMHRAGAEGMSFPVAVASGPNTQRPISMPTDRPLGQGDFVVMDIGAVWNGYCSDVTRTFVVGQPSVRQREVYDAVAETLSASTAMVRPGVPGVELHRTAVALLQKHAIAQYFTHRVGHGIGLETSLEAPDLEHDERSLEPGMTFCLEPGVYIPGFGGVKVEDDVIVTETGCEVISHAPTELISL